MRAGNSSIPPEGLRQGLHTEEIRQGAIERTTASNSLAPASRTKPYFATLRGGAFLYCRPLYSLAFREFRLRGATSLTAYSRELKGLREGFEA